MSNTTTLPAPPLPLATPRTFRPAPAPPSTDERSTVRAPRTLGLSEAAVRVLRAAAEHPNGIVPAYLPPSQENAKQALRVAGFVRRCEPNMNYEITPAGRAAIVPARWVCSPSCEQCRFYAEQEEREPAHLASCDPEHCQCAEVA